MPSASKRTAEAFEFVYWVTDPAQMKQAALRGNPPSVDPNSGYIGLQTHTGAVAFANVRIQT